MPKTSDMRESKFLKQTDVGAGVVMTVTGCARHNVAKEGAEEEQKWCLELQESDKPLVLNATNIQLCERVFGSDDTDHWVGKKIVLYVDPTVSYGGKVTGGIRVRAPRQKPVAAVPAKPAPVPVPETEPDNTPDFDDDVPF